MPLKLRICEAPICVGSPTVGSDKAYAELRPYLAELFGDRAEFADYKGCKSAPDTVGDKRLVECETVMTVNREIYRMIRSAYSDGCFPIALGGDHSIAMASIDAISDSVGKENIAVIYIDGHTDINTEKTTETGYIHGMPLAQTLGLCSDRLNIGDEKKRLLGENIHIIGARSIDSGEYRIIEENGVNLYTENDVKRLGIRNVLKEVADKTKGKRVHISFDVDAIDGEQFHSTGYVMSGGMDYSDAYYATRYLLESCDIVSFDCVEYNPSLDKDGSDRKKLLDLFALFK